MSQCVDFSGLEIGNMSATDMDGCMEYKDKLFIFVETKYDDADIPKGQRLFLEHLVDAVQHDGKVGIAFKTKHYTSDDIMLAATKVTKIYYLGKWRDVDKDITLVEARDELIRKHVPEVAELLS